MLPAAARFSRGQCQLRSDVNLPDRQALGDVGVQFDLHGIVAMLAERMETTGLRRSEGPLATRVINNPVSERLQQLRCALEVAWAEQQVDVRHRPHSGCVELHLVQRSSLERLDDQSRAPGRLVEFLQHGGQPEMPGSRVITLCPEVRLPAWRS
jgi:hypothetical protein